MARKHEPGTVVKTPSDRKAIILSAEKRGKKFYYQLEDEEGNKFEHIETGLTVTDSTPAEIDAAAFFLAQGQRPRPGVPAGFDFFRYKAARCFVESAP